MKRLTPVLIAVLLCGCKQERVEPILTGMENKPLPAFNILLPDSTTYFNTANFARGKKVLLFYYTPGCPYCRAEMRELVNNIERFKNEQICVLTTADFRSMKEFNEYFELHRYPNIITGIDTGAVIARKYNAIAVPFTAVFGKDKRLKSAYVGRLRGRDLLRVSDL